jgi:hypothetical protein
MILFVGCIFYGEPVPTSPKNVLADAFVGFDDGAFRL